MQLKKGDLIKVSCRRKGLYTGKVEKDFDSKQDTFIEVRTMDHVEGMNTDWAPGEKIPCRYSLCDKIELITEV